MLSTCTVCSLPFAITPGASAPGVCVACHQREVARKGTMKGSDLAKGYNALLKGYNALQKDTGGELHGYRIAVRLVARLEKERDDTELDRSTKGR